MNAYNMYCPHLKQCHIKVNKTTALYLFYMDFNNTLSFFIYDSNTAFHLDTGNMEN